MAAPAPDVRRVTILTTAGFVVATTLVLALLWYQLQEDRLALVARIEEERRNQVDEVVRLVAEDVGDVVDDLALMSQLVQNTMDTGEQRDVLSALLATVRAYRAAAVYREGAEPILVVDPRRESKLDETVHASMQKAVEALEDGERVVVSPALGGGSEWFRVFGKSDSSRTTIVLVVDTAAWLTGLRMVSSDPQNRILVLGPSGGIAPATDPVLKEVLAAANPHPELARLVERMRGGERGTARLGSNMLPGFEPGEVVVAYAPIQVPGAASWSVATFTSTGVLKAQEEALARRFVFASGAVVLLLIGFAAYVVVASRRRAVLVERLRHAAELAELNAQLLHAEKLATVGGLSAGIAHEIGTPLGVVRGRAEYLMRKLGEDHPQTPSLRTIIEQIDRVSRIIRELLDFARPRPMTGRPVRLPVVAERVRELLAIEFERSDLSLTFELPTSLPPLAADEDQLQQVLVNLLINARDASSGGSTVFVSAEAADGAVVLEVRDEGPGIPPEYLHRVFDPFFTTKKRGQGTGLGLSVVSQIVRSHNGEVAIDSEPGRGTVVRIRWPIARQEEAA